MTKNVTVLDSEGMIIGKTYPKRAAGLVKNGRARYCEGPEPAIILSRSPDIETSEEDEIMSTYNSDELRERIDSMLREAREKLDSVCKSAADTIDEFVSKIDSAEKPEADEQADDTEVQGVADVQDNEVEEADTESEPEGEAKPRAHFIRLSDEDIANLRKRMADMRESFCRAAEEAKKIAVKTGAEIGRYAEGVKARVSEKLAEREAESAAKAEAETPGTEAYYLRRIEEIGRDTAHFTAMESAVREYVTNSASENDAMSDAVQSLVIPVREHELTNRRLLDFYIGRLEAKQHESKDEKDE